jgi:hypothetical protein
MAGGPIGGSGPNRVIEFVPNIGLIPDSQPIDPALMLAMNRPWPDIVFSQPQVVASGMTPPESVPT